MFAFSCFLQKEKIREGGKISDNPMAVFLVRVNDTENCLRVRHQKMPEAVLTKLEKNWETSISPAKAKEIGTFCRKNRIKFRSVPKSYGRIPKRRPVEEIKTDKALWDKLYDYQRRGVREIICRLGSRALLGDEMGLGKSMQGVAYISHRLNKFPTARILIVCPSYLQIHWQHELQTHIGVDAQIWGAAECPESTVVIMPYSKLSNRPVDSIRWETIVADEAHYVKTRTSQRTKAFIPLCHKCSGLLLMTGTPCVNRPNEIFTLMYAIRPQHVLSYHKFAERFCDARQTRFGWTDTGSSNADELFWLLKKEYMVRRLKRDVLTQLEPKVRYSVLLNVRSDMLRRLNEIRGEMKSLTNSREHMMRRKALVSEAYRETAKAKAEEVSKWVNDRIENTDEPFLVFAHHQVTLDTLERNLKIDNYMRIDGSVNKEKRQQLVDEFQAGGVRVALLSIMAAGTGLTLTRASLAVFAELYWCPGQLLQAEDRVHRVGQQNSVSIIYLLGSGTVDTKIYPQVVHKLKVLDKAVDNRSDRSMNAISII